MSNPYAQQPPATPPPGNGPGSPAARTGDRDVAGRRTSKRAISTGQILGGLLFVVVLVFVLENTRTVKVRLLIPEVKAPLAVVIVIAAVLGALIAWLLRYRRHHNHPTTADRR